MVVYGIRFDGQSYDDSNLGMSSMLIQNTVMLNLYVGRGNILVGLGTSEWGVGIFHTKSK